MIKNTIGRVEVAACTGDISASACAAIVCAANDHLQMGGGVAGALGARGGLELQREANERGPIALGSIARTGAHDLGAQGVRWIYHAAVIRYDLRGGSRLADVQSALQAALAAAERDGVESLALPLLGAGVGGLRLDEVIDATLEAVEACPGRALRRVEVVTLDDEDGERLAERVAAWQPAAARQAALEADAEDFLARFMAEHGDLGGL